jgi:hypothetical protein
MGTVLGVAYSMLIGLCWFMVGSAAYSLLKFFYHMRWFRCATCLERVEYHDTSRVYLHDMAYPKGRLETRLLDKFGLGELTTGCFCIASEDRVRRRGRWVIHDLREDMDL